MVQGRIEVTPEEQLQGLRDARDRYAALADRLRDSAEPEGDLQKKLELERDARRIANAYEKSLANSMARTAGMRQARLFALPSLSAGMWLTIFVAISVAEGTALLAFFRPAIFQIKPAVPLSVAGKINLAAPMARDKVQRLAAAAMRPDDASKGDAGMVRSGAPKVRPFENRHQDLRTAQTVIAFPRSGVPSQAPPRITTARQVPRPLDLAKPPPVATAPKPSVQQPAPTAVTAVSQILPPPDPAKPVPVAAAPELGVQQQAPPSTATFILVPPLKPAVPVQPSTKLEPVARTHLSPPYPTLSKRLGERGTTLMQVSISTQGTVTDCKTIKTSGSVRLDTTACTFVQEHWRWKPPTQDGKPITASERVSVIWNLEDSP